MKFSTLTVLALISSSVDAFSPNKATINRVKTQESFSVATSEDLDTRPLRDPFGLYPENASERKQGLLEPLESKSADDKTVKDPLNMYKNKSDIDDKPMSASVPFLKRPAMLDGSLPGDRGFDPLNFAADADALQWYRSAEIKHARLAMLAAVGWPMAELFDKKLAYAFDLKSLLVYQDRVPSVLNGGLSKTPAAYWAAVLGVAFAIESFGLLRERSASQQGINYTPGDLGFDPLGLATKEPEAQKYKLEAELFNGRLAMLGITGFAIQEWWTQNSVINETPLFFKPLTVALEQIAETAASNSM